MIGDMVRLVFATEKFASWDDAKSFEVGLPYVHIFVFYTILSDRV